MTRSARGVSTSVGRGIEFLLSHRSSGDWWQDFETLAGESDEWVTAYTGCCLAQIPEGYVAASRALELLLTRRRDAGWGYNRRVPSDCDTTAWVCRLIELLGWTVLDEYHHGIGFLQDSILSNGGLPTYPSDDNIRAFTQVSPEFEFVGWMQPHSCVTANVASLRPFRGNEKILSFLSAMREPAGSWCGYWWIQRAYPTMLAADALGCHIQTQKWASESQEASAFSVACRMRIGVNLLQQLLDMQVQDGGWPASAQLRVPAPFVKSPEFASNRISLDKNRIYTTATALWALSRHVE